MISLRAANFDDIGPLNFAIDEIGPDRLAEYASVRSICEVTSTFVIDEISRGVNRFELREHPVPVPYTKNYDEFGGPLDWRKQFDISQWGVWLACDCGKPIGGAAVARNVPAPDALDGRCKLAVLWDIRVHEMHRRRGVGKALFQQAAGWAKAEGYDLLRIETQNVNVTACGFYKQTGCALTTIDRLAYRQHPAIADEIMLVWHLRIT